MTHRQMFLIGIAVTIGVAYFFWHKGKPGVVGSASLQTTDLERQAQLANVEALGINPVGTTPAADTYGRAQSMKNETVLIVAVVAFLVGYQWARRKLLAQGALGAGAYGTTPGYGSQAPYFNGSNPPAGGWNQPPPYNGGFSFGFGMGG